MIKNYNYLFLLLLLFTGFKGYGQCPVPGFLVLKTQASIDAFLIDYPNCTQLTGGVTIKEDVPNSITNLNGLQNLTALGGSFDILDNESLINLDGLDNLVSISSYFRINGNNALEDINGLGSLTSVGSSFSIIANNMLENTSGLGSLISVGGSFQILDNGNLSTLGDLGGLTSFNSSIVIRNNHNLVNINGLENLGSVNGSITIESNGNLQNLNSLLSLTTINGNLSVWNNRELEHLNGLSNIISINGDLTIGDCDSLLNLDGLESLNAINGSLDISGNAKLKNISGLENLQTVGDSWMINITGNASLESITGLAGLLDVPSIDGYLIIHNNTQLSYCSIPITCYKILNDNYMVSFTNNASGCNTYDEILSNCSDYGGINFQIYYDLNENAIKDSNEHYIPSIGSLIQPDNIKVYSNSSTGGFKYLSYGNYTIALDLFELSNWQLTTSPSAYNITLGPNNELDTAYFGLYPSVYLSKLITTQNNSLPRCKEIVRNWFRVVNEGTTVASGTLWFDIDTAVLDVIYVDIPDTLDGDHRVGWHFTDLYPNYTFSPEIDLQFPGPPEFALEDSLHFFTTVTYEDQNGSHVGAPNSHPVEVQCGYDPNDKLVSPHHFENYALIGEELIYTIRFQNTGNAEAYDVVITDELDANLDLSSFRYIGSSHEPVLSTYLKENLLTFEFKNIYLPDSTTNFDESQGYAMYSIRVKSDLEDYTTIENTANIFFDLNPAVVTNTTENIMLSTFDFDEDGFEFWNDCDDNNALAYPGAEEVLNNGVDEDCDGKDFNYIGKGNVVVPWVFPNPTTGQVAITFPRDVIGTYQLSDLGGKLLLEGVLGQEVMLDVSGLADGVYVLVMNSEGSVWVERVVKL